MTAREKLLRAASDAFHRCWSRPEHGIRYGECCLGAAVDAAGVPRRGDPVEQWLKARRDAAVAWDAWHVIDGMLDRYRLHADTGTPLDRHVREGKTVSNCDCQEQAGTGESR